jgi:hypothetical protein
MLKFNVFNQRLIRVDKNNPATDSVEYLEAQFIFNTDDWNGKAKSAIFTKGTSSYTVLLDSEGVCKVPFEVLQSNESSKLLGNTDKISVSLIGIYNTVRITTNEVKVNLNYSGYTEGQEPSEPTAEMYEQILAAYADAEAKCEETQQAFTDTLGLYANAIKGNVSGTTVVIDDVSPIEHKPIVKVCGKNLFDTSKFEVSENINTDYPYVTAVGEGYIDITVVESYNGNGHIAFDLKLKDVCPQMVAGRTYFISANSGAWNKCIYLKQLDHFWNFGNALTITEEMLECNIGLYGYATYRGQEVGTCRISNIQVEEGTIATEYTPYIDPTNTVVTVGDETFIASSNGSIEGITSITLTDGISTEAEGLKISIQYNKDINVVLNKIVNALGIEI